MTDPMQIAQQRRQDYEDQIAQKQDEIQQLEAMIVDLENFLAFGQELIGAGGTETTAIREVTRPVSATIQAVPTDYAGDANETEAEAEAAGDDFAGPVDEVAEHQDIADAADDWVEDDPADSIARMLAAHKA